MALRQRGCSPNRVMTLIRICRSDASACQGMTGEPTDGALSRNGGWSADSDARWTYSQTSTRLAYTPPAAPS